MEFLPGSTKRITSLPLMLKQFQLMTVLSLCCRTITRPGRVGLVGWVYDLSFAADDDTGGVGEDDQEGPPAWR